MRIDIRRFTYLIGLSMLMHSTAGCVVVREEPAEIPLPAPDPVLEQVRQVYFVPLQIEDLNVTLGTPTLIDDRRGDFLDVSFAADDPRLVYAYAPEFGTFGLYEFLPEEKQYVPLGQSLDSLVSPIAPSFRSLVAIRIDRSGERTIVQPYEWASYENADSLGSVRDARMIYWGDRTRLAFTHGDENIALSLFQSQAGSTDLLDDSILGPVQKIPGRDWLAYAKEADDDIWIKTIHLDSRLTRTLTPVLVGADSFFFLRDGRLLMTKNREFHVWKRVPGRWELIAELPPDIQGDIKDVRINSDGSAVAITVQWQQPAGVF